MYILFVAFLGSLLAGQLEAMTVYPGVTLYFHDVVLVAMVALNLRRIAGGMKSARLIGPMAAFILAWTVSLAVNGPFMPSDTLLVGILYLARWVLYALFYLVVGTQILRASVWLAGFYALSVGFALFGFIQFVWYPDLRNLSYLGWDPHYQRLFSTLLDPNFAGILFVFGLVLGSTVRWRGNKRIMVLCQIVLGSALLLTFSRSSYLAAGVAGIVWASATKRWKALFGALIIVVFLLLLLPKTGEGRNLWREVSTLARIENWKQSVAIFVRSPLVGRGFDTLSSPARLIVPDSAPSRSGAGIDSSVLYVLAITGIVGSVAYGWILMSLWKLGMLIVREAPVKHVGCMLMATLASAFVHSFFNNSLFYPWVMLWVWMSAGVTESLLKKGKNYR